MLQLLVIDAGQFRVSHLGRFYTNITLKGASQEAIIASLERQSLRAVVAPTRGDMTVVIEALSEAQDGAVNELARDLSQELGCVALSATNHDDSVFYFQLFNDGELLDDYNSSPSHFTASGPTQPSGGDAHLLCDIFRMPTAVNELEQALRFEPFADGADETDDRYVFECDRHVDLVRLLGLSTNAIGAGFNYIIDGSLPEGLTLAECEVLT